jgi:hypothetical protein
VDLAKSPPPRSGHSAGRHTYSHRCSRRQDSHPGTTGSQ